MNLDKDPDSNLCNSIVLFTGRMGLIAHECLCLLNIVLRNYHFKNKCVRVRWIRVCGKVNAVSFYERTAVRVY